MRSTPVEIPELLVPASASRDDIWLNLSGKGFWQKNTVHKTLQFLDPQSSFKGIFEVCSAYMFRTLDARRSGIGFSSRISDDVDRPLKSLAFSKILRKNKGFNSTGKKSNGL